MENNNDNYDLTRLKSYNRFKGNIAPLSIDITTGQERPFRRRTFEDVYQEYLKFNINLYRDESTYDLTRLECKEFNFMRNRRIKLGNIAPKN